MKRIPFLFLLSILFSANLFAQRAAPPSWTSTEAEIEAWEEVRGTKLDRTEKDGIVKVDYESAFSWGFKPKGLRSYFFQNDRLIKIVFRHQEQLDAEGLRPQEALEEYKKSLKMEGARMKSEETGEDGSYTSLWKSRTKKITMTRSLNEKEKTFEIVRTYEPLD